MVIPGIPFGSPSVISLKVVTVGDAGDITFLRAILRNARLPNLRRLHVLFRPALSNGGSVFRRRRNAPPHGLRGALSQRLGAQLTSVILEWDGFRHAKGHAGLLELFYDARARGVLEVRTGGAKI
jgi:hypothetical protein